MSELGGKRRLWNTYPLCLLEFEPLCKEYIVCSSRFQSIRAKRNRAITFIGHQRWNLKVVKLRLRSPRVITGSTLESPAASSCPGHLFTILGRVLKLGTIVTRKPLPDLGF